MLGSKIKETRKGLGFKILDLSKITGLSTSYISKIENNKVKPDDSIINKIALALEVDYDYLVDNQEKTNFYQIDLNLMSDETLAHLIRYAAEHNISLSAAFEKIVFEHSHNH